jgi:murein DD-endopeptidase MepM/ murein hydrolase activator NlpD
LHRPKYKKLLQIVVALIVLVSLFFLFGNQAGERDLPIIPLENTLETPLVPITNANSRITKKPFGIYITPSSSPVANERFTGYHTGTDFEITDNELNEPVQIYALCGGKILVKNFVSGYGGVLIQECSIEGETYTVLYGHLNLATSDLIVGDNVVTGQPIAELGADKSTDTAGERKHLHLGIHKGPAIEYRGYVSTSSELTSWVDYSLLVR